MKFLLVLLVVGIGLWMFTAKLRGPRQGDDAGGKPGDKAPGQAPLTMVECAHCGLHLPAGDALPEGSRLYCSDAHRRLGPAPTGRE